MPDRNEIIKKLREVRALRSGVVNNTRPVENGSNSIAVATKYYTPSAGLYPELYSDSQPRGSVKDAMNTAFGSMYVDGKANPRPIAQIIDPSQMIAGKSLSFNKYVMDFINDSGFYGNSNPYTEQQLLMAYMTSVYLFAALRRVSNLISRIKIVAEIRQGNKYVRAPDTVMINRIFEKDGPAVFSRMYLNYAIYGISLAYKTKTLKAAMEQARGLPIYDYQDGAVAGLHVLDKPMWELNEDTWSGEVLGVWVQRGTKHTSNRNYLDRREFVYLTDWNPENPNRGRSITTVAIHEAVTNSAIARWSAEYFTRGAMPFVLVAMEEDPAMVSDADLMKYKRQFEEHWAGMNSSLRSVFIDRNVTVQQVGIPASEVAADELNAAALEGISAAVGLDRELIVTPAGGSQERHSVLVKRAWEDTIIPMANGMLSVFARDMGLPDDMRLALDLSHIQELDADRDEKVSTEMSVFDGGMQTFNETRARLNMPAIPQFDGMLKTEDGFVPIESVVATSKIPMNRLMEAYSNWFDKGVTSFNDYRRAMGMHPVKGLEDVIMLDGKPVKLSYLLNLINMPTAEDLQRESDLMDKGLRSFNEARQHLGLSILDGMDNVINLDGRLVSVSEVVKHIWTPIDARVQFNSDMLDKGLKSFNEVREALGLNVVSGMEDVFMLDGKPITYSQLVKYIQMPSDTFIQTQTDLMDKGLRSFNEIRTELGLQPIEGLNDVFMMDGKPTRFSSLIRFLDSPTSDQIDFEMRLLEGGIQSVNELRINLGRDPIPEFDDWYMSEGKLTTLRRMLRQDQFLDDKLIEQLSSLWQDNLILKSKYMSILGIDMQPGEMDGYKTEVENAMQLKLERSQAEIEVEKERKLKELEMEFGSKTIISEAKANIEAEKLQKAAGGGDDSGGGGGGGWRPGGFRSADADDVEIASDGYKGDTYFRTDGYINSDKPVPVYVAPNELSVVTAQLYPEDVIEIINRIEDGKWVHIKTPDNVYGWVVESCISTDKTLNNFPIDKGAVTDIGIPDITVKGIRTPFKSEEQWIQYAQESSDVPNKPISRPPEDFNLTEGEAIEIAERLFKEIEEKRVLEEHNKNSSNTLDYTDTHNENNSNNNVANEDNQNGIIHYDGDSLYVSLWLGDQPVLRDIQSKLKNETRYDPDIDWVDPKTFHLTLVYVKGITPERFEELKSLLPSKIGNISLNVGPIAAFKKDYETVLYITVRSTPTLEQLQQQLNIIFGSYGVPVSEFSDPAKYIPHITMAYMPPETVVPEYDRYETVRPASLVIGRDNYRTIHVINFNNEDNKENVDGNSGLTSLLRDSWSRRIAAWRQSGLTDSDMPTEMIKIAQRYNDSSVKSIFYDGLIESIQMGAFDAYPEINYDMIKSNLPGAVQATLNDEIKAWERKAVKSFKSGNLQRAIKFESRLISEDMRYKIIEKLSSAKSIQDIRNIFDDING